VTRLGFIWLGSLSTEQYVLFRSKALREVHRRTGTRLVIISGSDQPPDEIRDKCDAIRWDLGSVLGGLADYDIGISPLPDSPWTRGKCAYEFLQYGAAGLPVVGSPVGANSSVLKALNGGVATSDNEWVEQLESLLTAPSTIRAAMGRTARRAVETAFSFDVSGRNGVESRRSSRLTVRTGSIHPTLGAPRRRTVVFKRSMAHRGRWSWTRFHAPAAPRIAAISTGVTRDAGRFRSIENRL
jgi:hypothetical protein